MRTKYCRQVVTQINIKLILYDKIGLKVFKNINDRFKANCLEHILKFLALFYNIKIS